MKNEIVIVGGGIGGLAAALALAPHGWTVRLLEQANEIAPIGYGIQLGPNVLATLRRLGVADEVLAAAHQPSALTMRDARDGELCRIDLGSGFRDCFEGRYLCIHRGDLHDILIEAAASHAGIILESSALVQSIDEGATGIAALTADGRRFEAELLIATDGLKSALRDIIHPADSVRQTGYVAHRTVISMGEVPGGVRRDEVTLWVGEGYHLIYYSLREGRELNIVAVFREDLLPPAEPHGAYRDAVLSLVADDHPEVRDILALMDLDRRWPIGDRNPVRPWASGRMTLLGDSAHATLQSLAQGAGMAFEDALVLGDILANGASDPARLFSEFEQRRYDRTTRVQMESRALWTMYHCGGRDREARNRLYRGKTNDNFYECLAWLWQPAPQGATEVAAEIAAP